ncbi:MAG: hypothetical protein J07HX64_01326 [halophilic archaeon J07HX64]|nr:MAG: hypothetical protein J07HX64_01326 [halophilic archaeon J07HX64]
MFGTTAQGDRQVRVAVEVSGLRGTDTGPDRFTGVSL